MINKALWFAHMDVVLELSKTDPKTYRAWFEASKAELAPKLSKFCFELYNAYYRHLTIDDVAKFPDRSLMSVFVARSSMYTVAPEIREILTAISPPKYTSVSDEPDVREYLKGATSRSDVRLMFKHAICKWTAHCMKFDEYERSSVVINGVSADALQAHAIAQYGTRCATTACMLIAFMSLRRGGLTAFTPLIEQTTTLAMIYCLARFCFQSLRIPGSKPDEFEPTAEQVATALNTVSTMLSRAVKSDNDDATVISRVAESFAASASSSASESDARTRSSEYGGRTSEYGGRSYDTRKYD